MFCSAVHISKPIAALIISAGLASATVAQEPCIATGDVDCSGSIMVGDISYMINFFEKGGPDLPCPYQVDIDGDCVVDYHDYMEIITCLLDIPGCQFSTPTCCNPVIKPCCLGDPNRSGGEPTISDVSVLIDARFISGACDDICIGAADFKGSGGDYPTCEDITISDISMLIDCLFITGDISPCYGGCRARH